ncbi:hypothetical protein MTR67_028615 [Solanum verrucosum]|uniref:Uncharacterized protein n=1 Tax=Solanum verrucosum TaxID=315347 RepID=A0AAF0U014_SOLVR|nr:hypothetical protein MTR67_028615 [Solanum verrucosum]
MQITDSKVTYLVFCLQSDAYLIILPLPERVILNCPIGRYGSMQSGVVSQPHLMVLNDRNYQLYSGVERGMLPPHESSATHNYFFGPSAPYAPPVLKQYASSEAVILEGTSSMSYQRSLIRRYG